MIAASPRPALGEPGGDLLDRLGRGEAVELAGVDQDLVLGVLDVGARPTLLGVGRLDDLADRQVERLGEVEVALVVRGHGHDRAGAVLHQHVVGDEDRDLLAVDGVGDGAAEGDPGLLALLGGAVLGGGAPPR